MAVMATGKSMPPMDPSASNGPAESPRHSTPSNSPSLRYRVGIAYPIGISGQDDRGEKFSESTVTQFIMRDGITLVSSRRLGASSKIHIKVAHENYVSGTVVGQTGFTKSGNVYAVLISREPASLWGINFPELSENERVELNCVLGCSGCGAKTIFQLTAVEYELLVARESITRPCQACNRSSQWKRIPNSQPTSDGSQATQKGPNRRRNSRVAVKLWGYIVEGGNEDSVPIIDMSRNGIRFRSTNKYEPEQTVQVAVAYMAGTANIFVPGKVVWRSGEDKSEYEYGLRFMSRSPIM